MHCLAKLPVSAVEYILREALCACPRHAWRHEICFLFLLEVKLELMNSVSVALLILQIVIKHERSLLEYFQIWLQKSYTLV